MRNIIKYQKIINSRMILTVTLTFLICVTVITNYKLEQQSHHCILKANKIRN